MSKNDVAFIIGNGESRKNFDLMKLKDRGTVFGCNALYRDFKPKYDLPDYLVAIDNPIITEIECSDFPPSRFIVPSVEEQFEPAECNPNRPRSNAGMNAMLEAVKMGHSMIYGFGFDFLLDDDRAISNIYEGSNCYESTTRASWNDTINRVNFFEWMAQKFDDVKFRFIFPGDKPLSIRRVQSPNVTGQSYDAFERYIRNVEGNV